MKKAGFPFVILFHLVLWTVCVSNPFGIDRAWAAEKFEKEGTENAVQEKVSSEEKKSTDSEVVPEKGDKSPAAVTGSKQEKAEQKRPKGISDKEWEKLKAKKVLPYDKGPTAIDISKYPKEMQDIYKNEFSKKCAKCHTIARAINAPYALSDEWRRYIKKMMKKPGSGINPSAGKKIHKFLVYDSKIRKKELIEKRLRKKGKKE